MLINLNIDGSLEVDKIMLVELIFFFVINLTFTLETQGIQELTYNCIIFYKLLFSLSYPDVCFLVIKSCRLNLTYF